MRNIFAFSVIILCNAVKSDDNVDYYVNLIKDEIDRASKYPVPTDASFFQSNLDYTLYNSNFDYIIVGAGSAGAVVANRLSEVKENQVLLLEAGGHESNFSDIPAMKFYLQGLEFNWNYVTTPQTTSCLGMVNKECAYPRGKGLGGTSIINALMYVRGNKRDYDNWFNQGNPGWSYKDVLPFFKKSEKSRVKGDKGYHGKGGYLNVEYFKDNNTQYDAFVAANLELGRKFIDYNGKKQLGVSQTQLNTIGGRRCSTGKAFLLPAMNRPNLKILTHSFVRKVMINPKTKKAYGVLFNHNGASFIVKARKEIIISAGAIGSPQLLMLSGIGPEEHLRQHNIPVLQSLNVGDNFKDHPTYFALHFVTNYTIPTKNLKEHVKEYLDQHGMFTIPGNSQGLGFYQTKYETTPSYPDIELIIVPSINTNEVVERTGHYTAESYNSVWAKMDPYRSFTLFVILLHPKSHGTLRLKSDSPYDYPLIDPRFLSDPEGKDIETMYQGVQIALNLMDTNAFKKLNASLFHAPLPACANHKYLSRAYWYCQLRQLTFHIYHPVGTCKMGPSALTGAVVDHELKVHGIGNLRVADTSIIPEPTSGHTNAVAIMIGEKVSEMIKSYK